MVLLAVIVPFWTSYLLRVYAWQAILGETGALNQFLMAIGLIHEPLTLLVYNDLRRLRGAHLRLLPVRGAGPLRGAREVRLHPAQRGAGPRGRPDQAFRHILLPQIRTGIITACIFVFIPILGEFLTPTLVGGARGSLIAT